MTVSLTRVAVWAVMWVAVTTVPAQAQMRRASMGAVPLGHRFEIGAHGGYVWTGSREVYYDYATGYGKLDIGSGGFWGITADFTVGPGAQLELLYNRQDSKLKYKPKIGNEEDLVNIAVEYWHIGGLYGIQRGNLLPFGSMTLGATRLDYKDKSFSDTWKFSILLGLGAKAFVNDRFGLRAQARLPFTFVNGGFGLGCGPGGCYTTVGGNGVAQFDVGGGAFVMF